MINPSLIGTYRNIDWTLLLRSDLGGTGQLTEAKPTFDRIKSIFDQIIENPVTASLAKEGRKEIETELRGFLNFVQTRVSSYSNVGERSVVIDEIKSIEWKILSSLGKILPYYPAIGEQKIDLKETIKEAVDPLKKEWEMEKKEIQNFKNFLPKIEKIAPTVENLIQNADSISEAVTGAKEWVVQNKQAIELIIQNNATDASKKAREHQTIRVEWSIPFWRGIKLPLLGGTFFWLIGSILSAIVAFALSITFINEKREITLGASILRISSILGPVYFTLFFAQQYLNHRRLYEAYKFKDLALQTMLNLKNRFPDNSQSQEKIVEKSLDVLFSEPFLKEEVKYDKQLLLEIFRMLKKD